MASGAEQEVDPGQPHGRRLTTIQKAILIGAVVALLAAGASSLATARLTDRQSDLDELASQVSERAEEVDRLNAEIAALEEQVQAVEAEKATLEEQLSEILNPPPGPAPTALLTASWVEPFFSVHRYAAACVEIENTSGGDVSISYSYSQFSAIDGDNFVYPAQLTPPGEALLGHALLNGQLSPGQKTRGVLLFQVPLPAVLTTLAWDADFGERPEIAVELPPAREESFQPAC